MSLSFKEVDPSVLGPKYKSVKVKAEKVEAKLEALEELKPPISKEPEHNEMIESYQKPFVVDVPQPEEKKPHFVIGIDSRVPMPCPFCGGESKIKTGVEPIGAQSMLTAYARCYCDECKTMGPKFYDKDKNGQFIFDSLDAWNRRK